MESLLDKDADEDGHLSKQEFEKFWERDLTDEEHGEFAAADRNGDGFIDVPELKFWEHGHVHVVRDLTKFFEAADRDGDMHITPEEIVAAKDKLEGKLEWTFREWADHYEL